MPPPLAGIFDSCRPRADILAGRVAEADFAADLARVVRGEGGQAWLDPARFFADTYPTRGLKALLASVCRRLSGAGGEAAAIFRLDTSYGGGKTHALIALTHAARGVAGVPEIAEFVDPALLPRASVRVAAFDGENADPANGRAMGGGVRARTPWGEIACALAGPDGYESVRASDEARVAPGAETLRELFGGAPTLILLDELSVWLRKARPLGDAGGQLAAFLTAVFKAVESAPRAALVHTLAIGKEGRAADAYRAENDFIADRMAEAESVSARKATLLDPTGEDETIQVLRRRLFESIDDKAAARAADAYRAVWTANADSLAAVAVRPETADALRDGYPFHPEVLETLTGKTATLGNFQRVRGMLRLLARTVALLWKERPAGAAAIHLHHIDPGDELIRQEFVTRLGQNAFLPALANDVAAGAAGKRALAEEIDAELHAGLPPCAAWAARTVFLHSLAFNEPLRGIAPERLRYSILAPGIDPGFIEAARKRLAADSAYLDDRPGAPMRFIADPNLNRIVRREEDHVDADTVRAELNDRIRGVFDGKTFETAPFPDGPWDLPDDASDDRPRLAILGYDAATVDAAVDAPPALVARIHDRKGAAGADLRLRRNNLVFIVADGSLAGDMRGKARRRLALRELKKPDRIAGLADHQQAILREWEARSEQELAIAIQQCYRHLFYPSRDGAAAGVRLAHTAIEAHAAADKPGDGQRQIVRALRDLNELRLAGDEPNSPAWVRDRTPLKKGEISTLALRDEFRRDPGLPMLVGDDVFIRGVRLGVEQGEYVYRRGDLLYGPGDPAAVIAIDEQAMLFTMAHARNNGIWPRPAKPEPDPPGDGGKVGEDRPPPPLPAETQSQSGGDFEAEGPLREALTRLWERARAAGAESIERLDIRMFDASDAFPLLAAIGAVSGAEKTVAFEGGYETPDGGAFTIEFRGPATDARPVRDFLDPQLRAAAQANLTAGFELAFADGLPMSGDAAEKFAGRLARFAAGAAHVSATARVEAP